MAPNYQFLVAFLALVASVRADSTGLYPQQTETRQVQSLDGVWNFRLTQGVANGFTDKWFEKSLDLVDSNFERMPVPSSFNDITESREIRDFSGWSWYDRKFFVPSTWSAPGVILLRFGSVNYLAQVYVNGKSAVNHTGGHLPFEADVTALLKIGAQNHISVAVNNELTEQTLPPGTVTRKNDTRKAGATFAETHPHFDFFNYAGIHRSVLLSHVPTSRIVDLTVVTDLLADLTTGTLKYEVKTSTDATKLTFDVELLDREGVVAVKSATASGDLQVPKANLWWAFGTAGKEPGYLYTLAIKVSEGGKLVDSWYQKVGIRRVVVAANKKELHLNGHPIYLRGFGKHEDINIRGRSLDQATILKDFNLMKWIGANSFRTSHYPYSELIMDEADGQGFVVVDEVPAVGLHTFSDQLLAQHLQTIQELIQRDKNRPSVFMWSIANEPESGKVESGPYFEKVAAEARKHDPTRLITAAINAPHGEHMGASLDVLMINRYYGWYNDGGYPQVIQGGLVPDLVAFNEKHNKPVMISEYGADTVPGQHAEPTYLFSEDYQTELLMEFHKAFDTLRARGFFIGEHVWNFADFMTAQGITRVGGNKKGIFTRDRQPKTSARQLRCRYWKLSGDLTNPHREGFSLCPESGD